MSFIPSDMTYCSPVNIAPDASKWKTTSENINIHYLHHNDRVFSLVTIKDDNDIKCMKY